MSEHVFASAPPTVAMTSVGLSFSGVIEFAKKAVELLQEKGDDVIGMLDAGFRAFAAVSSRDFTALFAALNDVNRTAQSIIDAIKETFGV